MHNRKFDILRNIKELITQNRVAYCSDSKLVQYLRSRITSLSKHVCNC